MHLYQWGGIAGFVLAVAFVVPSYIFLTGNLRDLLGQFTYTFADFLYGPIWAASIITVVMALRERFRGAAPRRMDLALFASFAAACTFVVVACIRATNRHYHLIHPELHLESSSTVLTVWTTLVAGVIAAAWHFLGWAWVLIGSASWTTKSLPRRLSMFYFLAGVSSLLVFLALEMEGGALVLGVVVSVWQGVLLIKPEPKRTHVSEKNIP